MSFRRFAASVLFFVALFIIAGNSFVMIAESNERMIERAQPTTSQVPLPPSTQEQELNVAGLNSLPTKKGAPPSPSPIEDVRDTQIPERKELPVRYSDGPWVSFNFDDGFESAYLHALPIMEAAGFKTTQYIVTGSIGYKNYISLAQLRKMQAGGHEIGAHTRTHPRLDTISFDDARNEIDGSKEDLLKLGITPATFAYPHGNHNPVIIDLVRQAGFDGARITRPGLNDASTDPYLLWYFGVNASTTLPMVQGAIDEAIERKKWLIFVFHRVDDQGADFENVSSLLLQQIVDYVKQKNIRVVTNAEGLQMLKQVR